MIARPAALAFSFVLLLAACTPGQSGGADPDDPDQVEVVSWFTLGSEKRGYDALVEEFTAANPNIEFFDASVGGGGDTAREALASRLANDNPPDAFQASAGAGLSNYVEAGRVQDLSDFYDEHELDDAFRDTFLDLLRVDGAIYSVPLDIQRTNIVWSNSDLLLRSGIDPATGRSSITYWVDDLQALRNAGTEFPLALGEGWTQTQLFETVLLADLGPIVYKNLWTSQEAWSAEGIGDAIEDYGQLLDFVDPESRAERSEDAIRRVINGDAAYVVMIDTAASQFEQAATSGHRYAAFPVPGTQGVFDFSVDAFALPMGAAHHAAARSWLLAVASPEGQRAFALKSGSIPARIDTDPADYPDYQRTAITSLQQDTVAPSLAHGVAASPAWTSAITDSLVRFRDDRRPAALLNALRTAAQEAFAEIR